MTNRKSSATGNAGDGTANAQENLNALFTAHQVHTLANLIYRQMTGGASWMGQQPAAPGHSAAPWATPGAAGMPSPQGFVAPNWNPQGASPMQFPYGYAPNDWMTPGAPGMPSPFGFMPHGCMTPGASPMPFPFGFMPHGWMTPGAFPMQAPQGFAPMSPSPAPSSNPTGGAGFAVPPALFYWYP